MKDSDGTGAAELSLRAKAIRRGVLRMASGRGEGYVGQGLGIADVMAALFFGYLRFDPERPLWPGRDRFVLSTGHYAIALYAALAEANFISTELLEQYAIDGDELPASTHHGVTGVESTTGSLGQGLSLACGMAFAGKLLKAEHRVVVLCSDGEQQEGSTWEAALFAAHQKLDNLVMLVDLNRTQADGDLGRIVEVEPLAAKWSAFGWAAYDVNGNDVGAVQAALAASHHESGQPTAIVCRSRLGAGVPLVEKKDRAHFLRIGPDEWDLAAAELEGAR